MNPSEIKIKLTQLKDLDRSCQLFMDAIAFQKRMGYPEYRWDDRAVQKEYIETGRHYKVVVQGEMAAIFNLQTSDEKIWRERDRGDAIYLHGVIVDRKFKGQKLFRDIRDWVIAFAKTRNRKYLRLDTWANNPKLENYYKEFGFKVIDDFQIPNTKDIPLNCRGNKVVLMEYDVSAFT